MMEQLGFLCLLAQLGAAGILGMPFVGAGIALMEELLGEDLKGKMINAPAIVTGKDRKSVV